MELPEDFLEKNVPRGYSVSREVQTRENRLWSDPGQLRCHRWEKAEDIHKTGSAVFPQINWGKSAWPSVPDCSTGHQSRKNPEK